MKMNNKFILVILGLLFLFSACSEEETFSEFHSFRNAEWDKQEAIRFEVPIHDISTSYNVLLELRNNNSYPFRNIWLFIDYKTPSGSMRSDTLCTDLADVYGKWYGTGMSLYAYSFPYQVNVQYPDTGIYVYAIRQGMRENVLKGISDIGLTVVK
ncbi:gliding motility lipoprotein GldH [Bacteroidia bacterium]|nr:gliding motility lipoprotein GldH [Bacteroidia bacterium]